MSQTTGIPGCGGWLHEGGMTAEVPSLGDSLEGLKSDGMGIGGWPGLG